MSAHITPLTRSQLLELENLFEKLLLSLRPATGHAHRGALSHEHRSGGVSPSPSSTRSSPSSSVSAVPPCAGSEATVNSFALDADASTNNHSNPFLTTSTDVDHPSLHGFFFDVFEDPLTKHHWRLYDKVLYLVWWSYRPHSCSECGMTDAWMPSGTCELQCAFCGGEAGSTRLNDYVGDVADVDENEDGDLEESGGSGVTGNGGERSGLGAAGDGGGDEAGAGAVAAYLFFYEWLQHVPLVRFRGSGGASAKRDSGADSGALSGQRYHADRDPSSRGGVPSSASGSVVNTRVSTHPSSRTNGEALGTSTAALAAGEVALPVGEELAMVLRAAYDLSTVLMLPGMAVRGRATGLRAAALYLSLLLHRYAVPFPLFTLARRGVESTGGLLAAKHKTTAKGTDRHMNNASSGLEPDPETDVQWVDVELCAALLGVSLTDFFESPLVAAQYMQNAMAITAPLGGVPSLLWHHARLPQRMASIMALAADRRPLCSSTPTAKGEMGTTAGESSVGYGRSPEHTAMLVALELARQVDAEPIAKCSTSTAAAAQNAARLGQWLDSLGVYASRRVYRTARAFSQNADFVASLTTQNALTVMNEDVVDQDGRPSSSLVAAGSPFADDFEVLLFSPCANTLLHIFARIFGITPLELCDMAERSGLYKGATRFLDVLRRRAEAGDYSSMPLFCRLSPLCSPWVSVYMALHSPDRLVTLSVLRLLNDVQNGARDRALHLSRVLQKIVSKYRATTEYQFNYVLHVSDESEPHFKGLYYLSHVSTQEGLVTFTCLRSGRKTITFNRHSGSISLCYVSAKEKLVTSLAHMELLGPVVASVEGEATRLVMCAVIGSVELFDAWAVVVRHLDLMGRIRRRMRVPMLASRLDALASIREAASASQSRHNTHTLISAATLAGWGATESLLAAPPLVEPLSLRAELQHQLYSLPSAAFLFGLSENRIVGMYAAQMALLEFIDSQIQRHVAQGEGEEERRCQPDASQGQRPKHKRCSSPGHAQAPTGAESGRSPRRRPWAASAPTRARGSQLPSSPPLDNSSTKREVDEVEEADGNSKWTEEARRDEKGERRLFDGRVKRSRSNSRGSTRSSHSSDAHARVSALGTAEGGEPSRGWASDQRRTRNDRRRRRRLRAASSVSSSSSSSSSSASASSARRSRTRSESSEGAARARGPSPPQPQPMRRRDGESSDVRAESAIECSTSPLPPCWVEELLATERDPDHTVAFDAGFDAAGLDSPMLSVRGVGPQKNTNGSSGGRRSGHRAGGSSPPFASLDAASAAGTGSVPGIRPRLSPPGHGAVRGSPPLRPSQPLTQPPPPPRTQHAVMTPVLGPTTPSTRITVTKRPAGGAVSPPPPSATASPSMPENKAAHSLGGHEMTPPLPPLTLSESVVPLPSSTADEEASASAAAATSLALSAQARAVAKELQIRRCVLMHLQHALPNWIHVILGHTTVIEYIANLEETLRHVECVPDAAETNRLDAPSAHAQGDSDGDGEAVCAGSAATGSMRASARRRRSTGVVGGVVSRTQFGIEPVITTMPPHSATTAWLRVAMKMAEDSGRRSDVVSPVLESTGAAAAGAALASSLFSMFDADVCRRQLHNLYVFLHTYSSLKRRLYVAAQCGALPAVTARARAHGGGGRDRRRGRTASRGASGHTSPAARTSPSHHTVTSPLLKGDVLPPLADNREGVTLEGNGTAVKRKRRRASSSSSSSSARSSASRSSTSVSDHGDVSDENEGEQTRDQIQPTDDKTPEMLRVRAKKTGRRRRRVEKRQAQQQKHQQQQKS